MEQHTRRKIQGFSAVVGITFLILLIGLPGARQSVTAAIKATLMRDVDNPANAPFAAILGTTEYPVPTTLPDGRAVQRLVIEFVSGLCHTFSSDVPMLNVSLFTTAESESVEHFMVLTKPLSTFNRWLFAQEVRLYADPDSSVYGSFAWIPTGPGQPPPTCQFHVSGYFVTQ